MRIFGRLPMRNHLTFQ